jgi:uncharacterized coiled-coil DUF342 family protein
MSSQSILDSANALRDSMHARLLDHIAQYQAHENKAIAIRKDLEDTDRFIRDLEDTVKAETVS